MGLVVTNHLLHLSGMPCTPRHSRPPQLAVACHDTEGGTTDEAMWATISWMHATAATRNASYNEFWRFSEITGELRVVVVVPATHAAHSVAPQPISPSSGLPLYQPDAQVKAALGGYVGDPNMWIYAVAVCGRVADTERFVQDRRFLVAAKQRIAQLEKQGIKTANLLEHFRFNPRTRTDWGRSLVPALKSLEAVPVFRNPIVTQEWDTVPGPGSTFTRPDGTTGYFTTVERVKAIADFTLNGVEMRLLDYGPNHEALTIPRYGGLTNPGLRIVGSPVPTVREVPTGITQEQVTSAAASAARAVANAADAAADQFGG